VWYILFFILFALSSRNLLHAFKYIFVHVQMYASLYKELVCNHRNDILMANVITFQL